MTNNPTPEQIAPRRATPEDFARASAEVARLQHELDITNADHIALWLEENMEDSTIGWLACRIIEAHEQEMALLRLKHEGSSDGR